MASGDDASYDVRDWAIRGYKGRRGISYTVCGRLRARPANNRIEAALALTAAAEEPPDAVTSSRISREPS